MSNIKSTILDEVVSFLTASGRRTVTLGATPLDVILPDGSTMVGLPYEPLEATGTLSQANIIAMFTTDVSLIAAPGAGKAIVVDEIEFFHDYSTAAYTSGGDVSVLYTGSTVICLADVTLVTAAADDYLLMRPTIYNLDNSTGTAIGYDLNAEENKGVDITNATGVFATGNAANIIKYRIRYHVITLLA